MRQDAAACHADILLPTCRWVVFFGSDEGLREALVADWIRAARRLAPHITVQTYEEESFLTTSLTEEPSLFTDQSEGRIWIVDGVSETRAARYMDQLQTPFEGWVILKAPRLTTTSKLIKWPEPKGISVGCYPMTERALHQFLQRRAPAYGFTMTSGAVRALAPFIQEEWPWHQYLTHLSLLGTSVIEETHVHQICGTTVRREDLWIATLKRDIQACARALASVEPEETMLEIRSLLRRLRQLWEHAISETTSWNPIEPPVFFRDLPVLQAVADQWSRSQLGEGFDRLKNIEETFKTAGWGRTQPLWLAWVEGMTSK